ncbi:MAG: hypothetical protein ACK5VM_03030 [Bacteroidota bacterium]
MKKIVLLLFTSLLSIALIAQPLNAEKRLQQLIEETPAAGLAVVVVKNNKIIYQQNFGYKNLENK